MTLHVHPRIIRRACGVAPQRTLINFPQAQHPVARSFYHILEPSLKSHTNDQNNGHALQGSTQNDAETARVVRARAIQAREPHYSGWWTEIMNYRQLPQTLPDPHLNLTEGHVFQGAFISSSSSPAPSPEKSVAANKEAKKGYSNALPTGPSSTTTNSLPQKATTEPSLVGQSSGEGSRLSGAAAQSRIYHGFVIPSKPIPPGAEDCCMSGCAHCIYDIYEEDRQDYKQALEKVLDQIKRAGLPPPPGLKTASSSGNDVKGKKNEDDDDDMDPSMKAFLALERKLKGS